MAEAVLLADTGSNVALETVTVLVLGMAFLLPAAVTLMTNVCDADVLAAMDDAVQVTVAEPFLESWQVHPAGAVADWNVVPAGSTSWSTTEVAACVPRLLTVTP